MGVNEIFNNLCNHHENEVEEFKKAENNFDFDGKITNAGLRGNLRENPWKALCLGHSC